MLKGKRDSLLNPIPTIFPFNKKRKTLNSVKLEPSEEVLTALLGTFGNHPVNSMGYFRESGRENRKV